MNFIRAFLISMVALSAKSHSQSHVSNMVTGQITAFETDFLSTYDCHDNTAFIKVDGSGWLYYKLDSDGGKAMHATVLGAISMGQTVKVYYLTEDHILNCGGAYRPIASVSFVF